MDEIDAAQQQEELLINTALANRSQTLKSPNGMCLWCHDEPIAGSSAFCSADCGEDYGKWQSKQINLTHIVIFSIQLYRKYLMEVDYA